MLLGRVIGTVWATRKDEKLEGLKLLVVRELDLEYKPQPSFVVAADTVQAGVGEVVLVCQGSSARQTKVTEKRPVDAVVMAGGREPPREGRGAAAEGAQPPARPAPPRAAPPPAHH